ncbi:hypothetical protein E2542_SST31593 [Spatholobus suberectus]|nr:hypothetical protein E2542_SST31593 [Spatholobus suberectus]
MPRALHVQQITMIHYDRERTETSDHSTHTPPTENSVQDNNFLPVVLRHCLQHQHQQLTRHVQPSLLSLPKLQSSSLPLTLSPPQKLPLFHTLSPKPLPFPFPHPLSLARTPPFLAPLRCRSPEAEAEAAPPEDEWLQKLPEKSKPLYSHSLPCIEAWLRSLGFCQGKEDRALWVVHKPDWHAQLSLDVTDLCIRWVGLFLAPVVVWGV